MNIYPAIDLLNGKCVRLIQGDFNKETVYNENPVEVAMSFKKMGATYLHVVDLDGARDGSGINTQIIQEIIEKTGLKVQTGGGIRSLETIEEKLNTGVWRVILGTIAIKNPDIVKKAIAKFGADRVVVGIDAKKGYVAVDGWEKVSDTTTLELCEKMKALGVKTIIYTDIAKDGMLEGPAFQGTQELVKKSGLNIVASGGVSVMEDVDKLSQLDCEGVIIGKAIYTGAIDLEKTLLKRW